MPDLTALAEKDIVTLLVIVLIGLLIALTSFIVYVVAPLTRGKNTEKDSSAKTLDGLMQMIQGNQTVNAESVKVLRDLSVIMQASKDTLLSTDTHMGVLADRNAALIKETSDSVKLLRTDVLAALDKLPAELREELSPIATEIRALSGMSEAISGKLAELQKTFLDTLQRMASPVSPVPVYISNADQFGRFRFGKPPPTLAESAKGSPLGEKAEGKP